MESLPPKDPRPLDVPPDLPAPEPAPPIPDFVPEPGTWPLPPRDFGYNTMETINDE